MRKLIIVLTCLSLVACNSTKKTASDSSNKFIVENFSEFNSEELKEHYPDANLEEGVDMFEEGTVEKPYSILYPGTPNELHITWNDQARTRVDEIRFSQNGDWKSKTGIKVGTTYDDLNKINGKAISFYGFGWDYSGAVVWNDGKLENSKLRVFISPENQLENKFIGDRIVEATDKEIDEMNLKVDSLIYKQNE